MMRTVKTTLTGADIRHVISLIPVIDDRGVFDRHTRKWTYPAVIKRKLFTLQRRLDQAGHSKWENGLGTTVRFSL